MVSSNDFVIRNVSGSLIVLWSYARFCQSPRRFAHLVRLLPRSSVIMGDSMKQWFVCTKCPLEDQCLDKDGQPTSFKRAKCWGETSEECLEQLKHHLMKSAHHMLTEDDADEQMIFAEVVIEEWPANHGQPAERDRADANNRAKRRKTGPRPPSQPPNRDGGDGISQRALEQIVTAIDSRAASGSGSDRGAASNVLPIFGPDASTVSNRSDKVLVSRGALQKAVDAIGRCHLAAEHARKMFQNAGQGFEAEANSMSDALDVLKTELGLDPAQRGPY